MSDESRESARFALVNYRSREKKIGEIDVGLLVAESLVPLEALADQHAGARALLQASRASELTPGIQGLLMDWEQSFNELDELAALIHRRGVEQAPWRDSVIALRDVHVLAPVMRPTKMLFAGANYERHVREVENWKEATDASVKNFSIDKTTTKPYMFVKLPYCVVGPDDPVVYPAPHDRLDWEGELALIIGKRGKHIPRERAMEYVAGFTIANDYSLRSLNMRTDWPGLRTDWFGGKNFDTAACLGPYLVPRQFVLNYLKLGRRLMVNGVVKQDASTEGMIFKPDELIAFASSIVTLEPGDVIATGSPPGAGFATNEFLKVGDVVELEIDGLGRQRNEIVAEQTEARRGESR